MLSLRQLARLVIPTVLAFVAACTDHTPVTAPNGAGAAPRPAYIFDPSLAPACLDVSGNCVPLRGRYISHYTAAGCSGTESYYTPYFSSDGKRRSWDGRGIAGTTLQTVAARSYRDSTGTCYSPSGWQASGNQLSNMVTIYRYICDPDEVGNCRTTTGAKYISHYEYAGCGGSEYYYTAYNGYDGVVKPWDGNGLYGGFRFTRVTRSYRDDTGTCYTPPAWQDGSNVLPDLAPIYRDVATCGDVSCVGVSGAYISHFTGTNCTGSESYYTPYSNGSSVRQSWDGAGVAGTTLQTIANRSYRDATGSCYTPAGWQPNGNPLSGFVGIYR